MIGTACLLTDATHQSLALVDELESHSCVFQGNVHENVQK